MEIVPRFTLELRHNDEVLGCLTAAGAVEALQEEVLHAEARFWIGLRGLRRPRALRVARPRYRMAAHA
jgi:hypothetical protein